MRRHEPEVGVDTEFDGHQRVDHAGMAGDDDAPGGMGRTDAVDGVHDATAEVGARLAEGEVVPAASSLEGGLGIRPRGFAEQFGQRGVARAVPSEFDLAQVFEDSGLEAVAAGDGDAGLVGSLQIAAIHGFDRLWSKHTGDRLLLSESELGQRWITLLADRAAGHRRSLLAVTDEDEVQCGAVVQMDGNSDRVGTVAAHRRQRIEVAD